MTSGVRTWSLSFVDHTQPIETRPVARSAPEKTHRTTDATCVRCGVLAVGGISLALALGGRGGGPLSVASSPATCSPDTPGSAASWAMSTGGLLSLMVASSAASISSRFEMFTYEMGPACGPKRVLERLGELLGALEPIGGIALERVLEPVVELRREVGADARRDGEGCVAIAANVIATP